MASCAWPSPNTGCPPQVVERDIANVTALGVEIEVNAPVEDLSALHDDGYEAVLVATGTPLSTRLGVPGDELDGVLSGIGFLRSVKLGEDVDLSDRRVLVIGGGNVAMDTARTRPAPRCPRGHGGLPAHPC